MSIVRKILFPTEFQELSFLVAQQLAVLAGAGLEEVVFVYVIDRDEVGFDLAHGFDEERAEERRSKAKTRFADWEKQLGELGLKARHRIEVGRPSVEILRAARDEDVDLIVTARTPAKGLHAVFLGGTSMELIRGSEFPVFVAKPAQDDLSIDDRRINPFQRVLLATDFSAASARAQALVKGLGPIIDEVAVVNVMSDRDPDPTDDQEALEAVAADLAGIGAVHTHLRRGRPTREILRTRDESDSTVIVMGTTGKHGIKEMFLGSCSHRCVEQGSVPVLLVPGPRG